MRKCFAALFPLILLACLETTAAISPLSKPTMKPGLQILPIMDEPASGAVFELEPTPTVVCMVVIAVKSLHVRAEPDENSLVLGWLARAERVSAGERSGDWVRVSLTLPAPAGRGSTLSGWSHGKYLEVCP